MLPQRLIMNLGYRQGFEMGTWSNFYFQFGGSFLGTKVLANTAYVANNQYSLYMYTANTNQSVAYQARTGVGLGFYVAPGFEFFIKDKYAFDVGFMFSRDTMKLIEYKQTGWNKSLYFTFTI